MKDAATHITPNVRYIGNEKVLKLYENLDGWFTTISEDGNKIGIWAPHKIKGYQAGFAHPMGLLQNAEFDVDNYAFDIKSDRQTLYYAVNDKSEMKETPWSFKKIDAAVKYVWMVTQRQKDVSEEEIMLRRVIQNVLTEAHYEPTVVARLQHVSKDSVVRTYKDIDDWVVVDKGMVKVIYAPSASLKGGGYVSEMGMMRKGGGAFANFEIDRLGYVDSKGKKHKIDWKFDDEENAVRFVYMQSQIPNGLNEGRVKEDMEIPDLPGWHAQRYNEKDTGGNAWWSIMNKGRYMGAIFDDGLLNMTRLNYAKSGHTELIGNPIQTARYIYLMMQPKKK